MATFVFTAIGSSFGPLGSALGSVVGGMIDAKLFGAGAPDGQSLDGLRITGSDQGVPRTVVLGNGGRCAGQVIFASPLREVTGDSGKGGGGKKGGPGQSAYFSDVAIAWAGHIQSDSVRKILAGSLVLYDADADVNIAGSTLVSAAVTKSSRTIYETVLSKYFLTLSSTSAGPDLSSLRSGIVCTVAGFVTGDFNRVDFKVLSSEKAIDGSSTASLRFPSGVIPTTTPESAGASVTITQNVPEFNPGRVAAITHYDGSQALADGVIEGHMGVGNVPAQAGTTYSVLTGLDVTKWAGSLPPFFAIVRESATRTVGQAIQTLATLSGEIQSSQIDVTGVSATVLEGLMFRGPIPPRTLIQQLMLVYGLEVQERKGVLFFFDRANATEITIAESQLAAREEGSTTRDRFQTSQVDADQLPSRVVVRFQDPNNDYQVGKRSYGHSSADSGGEQVINLSFAITAQEAAVLAKVQYYLIHLNSSQFKGVQLPPSEMDVLEADRILITQNGEQRRVRVTEVDRGDNSLVRVSGESEHPDIFTQTVEVEERDDGKGELGLPIDLDFFALDIPPLLAEHSDVPGLYLAAGPSDLDDVFAGATVYKSEDAGATFSLLENIFIASLHGVATGTLGGGVTSHLIDGTNTLTVVIASAGASLSSISDSQFYKGDNAILVGEEIIYFKTATLTATRTYDLTTLLRGRRGTEGAIGSHVADEEFVVLKPQPQFSSSSFGLTAIGSTFTLRCVPAGGVISDYGHTDWTYSSFRGNSARCLAPYDARGKRNESDLDLTVDFKRRTRIPFRPLSSISAPQDELVEAYEVDVMNGAAVVRTVVVGSSKTFIYTVAQQDADFSTTGGQAPITMRFYKIGDAGRGIYLEETFS